MQPELLKFGPYTDNKLAGFSDSHCEPQWSYIIKCAAIFRPIFMFSLFGSFSSGATLVQVTFEASQDDWIPVCKMTK